MGESTGIQWTDHTFNPWEGCEKVSPGCKHCYAEARNERFHDGENWGPASTTPRLLRSPAYWTQPAKWNREAATTGRRARVFCASLADVFEDHPGVERERARLFELIEATPHLDWQLLTKRPENMQRLAPASWADSWPPNVWAGTTVEDQRAADMRIPILAMVPARVRFLSCEPLLEAVDLDTVEVPLFLNRIHWVIVGGESAQRGRTARPFDLEWCETILAQARKHSIPCFVKQMGDAPIMSITHGAISAKMHAHHGADPSEWPEELRVREFPG